MRVKYWCNTHNRPAKPEYPDHTGYACIPCRGYIMIRCEVIDCDEVGIEIEYNYELNRVETQPCQ